jgi:hypothetical protein
MTLSRVSIHSQACFSALDGQTYFGLNDDTSPINNGLEYVPYYKAIRSLFYSFCVAVFPGKFFLPVYSQSQLSSHYTALLRIIERELCESFMFNTHPTVPI